MKTMNVDKNPKSIVTPKNGKRNRAALKSVSLSSEI
jgi:hypothetical protein